MKWEGVKWLISALWSIFVFAAFPNLFVWYWRIGLRGMKRVISFMLLKIGRSIIIFYQYIWIGFGSL